MNAVTVRRLYAEAQQALESAVDSHKREYCRGRLDALHAVLSMHRVNVKDALPTRKQPREGGHEKRKMGAV